MKQEYTYTIKPDVLEKLRQKIFASEKAMKEGKPPLIECYKIKMDDDKIKINKKKKFNFEEYCKWAGFNF